MKEIIKLKDFLDFTFLSDLTFAPDEEHGVFAASKCVEKDNSYQTYLYVTDGNTVRQLTSYGKEQLYIWEDEETVLFANMRDAEDKKAVENGEERTCFYRINIHGGEAVKAFTIPLQVTSIKKVAAGEYVFCADYHLRYSCMYMLDEADKKALLKDKKEMQDYEVLDELPFYGNGQGYTNKKRNTLFLYREAEEDIIRISDENCNVYDVELSEQRDIVYYTGESYVQKPKNKEAVYAYDLAKAKGQVILPSKLWSIGKILTWNDCILMIASEQKAYGLNENGMFYLLHPDTGEVSLLTSYEDATGSSVGSDCRYGGGTSICLYKDTVYFITTLFNRSAVYALNDRGEITPVYDTEGSVDAIAFAKDQMYFIGMQDMRLQELYVCDLHGENRRLLTDFNEAYFAEKDVRPCVPCNILQGDMELYGWVLEPRDYDPNKAYPAILDIHGGPKTVYGEVYYHEMQVWANKGYFVFFMNPRGGDGRGNSFADIRGKYGTIDYDDLMKFTDAVLKKYPAIDAERVGVTGGSYGGFMTNWIITHTDRFQAAASQRSISNWVSFAHTSDIGEMFGADQQAGDTWINVEKLWWHSPLKYADQCKTPTLFIHSDEDFRCPYSEGLQMYSALCEHGVETRLCMFRGENHELSRSGKPKHRVKRLEEITAWMDTHLCD
ncbi:S9 family peptidase [[Clostridium] innocuum]|nr:S9 family peptidase [[Clostridium] innocuum]